MKFQRSSGNQVTEKEGPLAGFQWVDPLCTDRFIAQTQSGLVKLQPTDEQQANAVLLEQIIASETSPRPLKSSSVIASQRMVRWALDSFIPGCDWSGDRIRVPSLIPVVAPVQVSGLSDLIADHPGWFICACSDGLPARSGR